MSKKHKNSLSVTSPIADSAKSKNQTTGTRNLGDTLTPHKYTATFVRSGTLGKYKNALIINIRDEHDHMLCDHLWVKWCGAFVRMHAGDVMSFTATPYRYIKGYSGDKHVTSDFSVDIGLKEFIQVRVIGHNPVIDKKQKEMQK